MSEQEIRTELQVPPRSGHLFLCKHVGVNYKGTEFDIYAQLYKCPVILRGCTKKCVEKLCDNYIENYDIFCPVCWQKVTKNEIKISDDSSEQSQLLVCSINCCKSIFTVPIGCNDASRRPYSHSSNLHSLYFYCGNLPIIIRSCDGSLCNKECGEIHSKNYFKQNSPQCYECKKDITKDNNIVKGLDNDNYLCCIDCKDKLTQRLYYQRCTICKLYAKFKCKQCITFYCSKSCQKIDLSNHKNTCIIPTEVPKN